MLFEILLLTVSVTLDVVTHSLTGLHEQAYKLGKRFSHKHNSLFCVCYTHAHTLYMSWRFLLSYAKFFPY